MSVLGFMQLYKLSVTNFISRGIKFIHYIIFFLCFSMVSDVFTHFIHNFNGSRQCQRESSSSSTYSYHSQTPGNVYFVHSSDGPSSMTVKHVQNHSNYHVWTRSICRALGSKNKFDFVDGSFPIPTDFDLNFKA